MYGYIRPAFRKRQRSNLNSAAPGKLLFRLTGPFYGSSWPARLDAGPVLAFIRPLQGRVGAGSAVAIAALNDDALPDCTENLRYLMSRRHSTKYKIDRRVGENIWGRPKSPVNKRQYKPGQHGQGRAPWGARTRKLSKTFEFVRKFSESAQRFRELVKVSQSCF